jgi:hypothetical protein
MDKVSLLIGAIIVVTLIWIVPRLLRSRKGKIDIKLEKYQFTAGEEIKGVLTLTLKKGLDSGTVKIKLLGVQKIHERVGEKARTSTKTVFDFEQPLDEEKAYQAGSTSTYNFAIKIPQDLSGGGNNIPVPGALGTAINLMGSLSRSQISPINWSVVGRIDTKGFDIKKKVKINIA